MGVCFGRLKPADIIRVDRFPSFCDSWKSSGPHVANELEKLSRESVPDLGCRCKLGPI